MQPFIECKLARIDGPNNFTIRESRMEPKWSEHDRTDKRAERNRRKSWFPSRPNMDETVSNEGTMVVDYAGLRVVSFLVSILNFVCRGHSTRGECCIILSDVTWLAVSAVAEEQRQAMTWCVFIGQQLAPLPNDVTACGGTDPSRALPPQIRRHEYQCR